MQRAFALISAGAGALVGLVKLVGLITGSQWLGDTWKATLGYVAAAFLLVLGVALVVWVLIASRPRRSDTRREPRFYWRRVVTRIVNNLVEREAQRRRGVPPEKRIGAARRPLPMPWPVVLLSIFTALLTLAIAAVIAANADAYWLFGVSVLGYAVLFGVVFAWVRHTSTPKCPYCLQPVAGQALVCQHCGRDLAEPSPEDDEPDWLWL